MNPCILDLIKKCFPDVTYQYIRGGICALYTKGIEFFLYPEGGHCFSRLPVFPDLRWTYYDFYPCSSYVGFYYPYSKNEDLYGLLCYMKQFQIDCSNDKLWNQTSSTEWIMPSPLRCSVVESNIIKAYCYWALKILDGAQPSKYVPEIALTPKQAKC